MNRKTLFLIMMFLSSIAQASSKIIFPESITVFSNDKYFINKNVKFPMSTTYKVINIDKLGHIDKRISKYLPPNEAEAKKAFSILLNSKQWPAIASEIKSAAFDIAKAAQYSLKKVPAIIFNEKEVIYGVTDIHEALILYTKSKRNVQ